MHLRILIVIFFILSLFSCSQSTEKVVLVANTKANCEDSSLTNKCLQFKELGAYQWMPLQDSIIGFNYQKGFFYKLKLRVTERDQPGANGALNEYKLLEIIDQSVMPLDLDKGSWFVTTLEGVDQIGRYPFFKIDLSKQMIEGNTGCNRFSAKIQIKDQKVTISKITSTEMLCREANVETAFLNALSTLKSFSIHDNVLQFLDHKNKVIMGCKFLKVK